MFKKNKSGKYKDNLIKRSEDARTVRKIVAIIIFSLVLILVIGGISGYTYVKSALQPVNPDSEKEVKVEIPMGSSTSSIASILEDNGIIKDSRVFRFYIKFKNESNFQAGEYTLTPSMTIDEIITALKNGKVLEEPVYTITIPEGKTIDEIAGIYAGKLPFSKDDFLNAVNDSEYIEILINTYPDILTNDILNPDIRTPLEGYLFAATYNFYQKEPSIQSVVEKMLDKTEEVVTPYLDEISAQDLTVHEALTMASLVEKESSSVDQRKKIASVFYNRLDEGMPLQTDPTVLYALGKHKEKVLSKDLKVNSPYNTYQINALPVGPISNFAKTSLEATLNPAETKYKYFLHDGEGNVYFSKTHDQHLEYKAQYIK
ncbi:endolytic transglycosylase MltG [Virgibacillus sp. JSM 102003]|uniref:endolytic transglycosylase MltG n=1 Tax=Virgibacillus sp. JSM 102003 TaxID=1562108 RepID=UPI0035BED3C3